MLLKIAAALIALAAVVPARASSLLPEPGVWAHRGGAKIAPENTLGAFRNAAALFTERGLPVNLELDVHLSSDGVPMVIHDATLDRTTTCTGLVAAWPAEFLSACDATELWPDWPFEQVPTLAAVVDAALASEEPWNLMIEIKGVPTDPDFDPLAGGADAVLEVLSHRGFPAAQTIIQSFWPPALEKAELAGVPTQLLTTSTLPGAPKGAGFTLGENAVFSTARSYEICAPDLDTPDLTSETVAAAQTLGRKVIVWTVNTREELAHLGVVGVDAVITDDPALLTGPSAA